MRPLLPPALVFVLFLPLVPARPAAAQLLADTVFTWQGYAHTSQCRIRLYAVPGDEKRPHVFVLEEQAENRGPSTLDDARYLAEQVGRHFRIDPAEAWWIFHWGPFSFAGAAPDRKKELFLRASFRRTKSQNLGAPSWRLLTREEVVDHTDRQFR